MTSYRTTASILRLRIGPGTDQAIIGRLPQGTLLDVLQGPVRGWVRARANLRDGNLTGWVSADHIETVAAISQLDEPRWLPIARNEIGVREFAGPQHNPRIVEYHRATSLRASADETAWCSSFVNWCMLKANIVGTDHAGARSWANWGVPLAAPRVGCVAVFKRHVPGNPGVGHVAFFLERIGGRIHLLGGNQRNSVSITNLPAADLIGYRWKA